MSQRPDLPTIMEVNLKHILTAVSILFISLIGGNQISTSNFWADGKEYRLVKDDAMIILRVADNLASGNGPYFNKGETVAANTSTFWPLLLSPVFMLYESNQAALLFLQKTTLLLVVLTLLLLGISSSSGRTHDYLPGVAALLFAFTPSVWEHSISVWEHIPQTVFVTAGFLVFLRRLGRMSPHSSTAWGLALAACGFLFRPDTAVLAAPLGAYAAHAWYRSRDPSLLMAIGGAAALVGLHFLITFHFYGHFLPNTYFLKMTGDAGSMQDGLQYLLESTLSGGNTVFLAGLAATYGWTYSSWSRREHVVIAAVGALVGYVVYVGGDAFGYGRFLYVITPISIFLLVEKIDEYGNAIPAVGLQASAAVLVFVLALLFPFAREQQGPSFGGPEQTGSSRMKQVSLVPTMKAHLTPEDGSVGLFFLGAISYYMEAYRMADFLGKADPHIAHQPAKWGPVGHNKWDIAHTLTEHNVAAVPMYELPVEAAKRGLARKKEFAYYEAFVSHPITQQKYTFLSARRLGLSHNWGLYVRNDLKGRFLADADTSDHSPSEN